MHWLSDMHKIATLFVIVLAWTPGAAQSQGETDAWNWDLTPYLWLPTIDGRLKYELPPGAAGAPEIGIGPVDWLDLLNFGALVGASVTKGRFAVFTDLMYLSMSSNKDGQLLSVESSIPGPGDTVSIPVGADLNIATDSELDGLLWVMAAGYAFADTEGGTHHLFAGVRLLSVDVSTDWSLSGEVTGPAGTTILDRQGGIGNDVDVWDGIVGVKGRFNLGEGNWSLPYTVDIGTGDSDLVWSATMSLSRKYGWGSLIFGYRHLEYDEGPGGFLQDLSFSGPGFGATFGF